jgi:hypothetical protein
MEKCVGELVNIITAKKYINLYSTGFTRKKEDQKNLEPLLILLRNEYDDFLIDIDIKVFAKCENEEDEAGVFLDLLNREWEKNSTISPIPSAISIAEALEKLSNQLNRRILVVFRSFTDIYDEKEKDIFRVLRKFIEIFEGSPYLGILIISDRPTYHWELYPESKLDERHVVFKEYP